jgi:DNA-binding transcriptional MocR family regulator
MDKHTGVAWPSRQALADATRLCVPSVDRALRTLEDAGYLEGPPRVEITQNGKTVERRPGGSGHTNRHRAAFPEQRHAAALAEKEQRLTVALNSDS